MRLRFTRPAASLALAFAAGLVALPACHKKDAPTTPDSKQPAPPNQFQGSKMGPPGGMPGPVPTPGNTGTPALYATSDVPTRLMSSNNLKQIAISFHSFASTYDFSFPAGIADKSGKVGLSWRVAILPFIEQGALYKEFKLDEPWDSENNKKLIDRMPATYAPPGGGGQKGYTYYRSFSGPDTIMPPGGKGNPGQPVFGLKLTSITDGTSNTLMVVEAGEPVIWTKPDELVYEKGKAPPKVGGGVFGDGFNAALCDGSVKWFKNSISPTTLGNAINVHDGNVVDLDQ